MDCSIIHNVCPSAVLPLGITCGKLRITQRRKKNPFKDQKLSRSEAKRVTGLEAAEAAEATEEPRQDCRRMPDVGKMSTTKGMKAKGHPIDRTEPKVVKQASIVGN